MGDIRKPKVKDYKLYELENIAADILKDAKDFIKGCRVDIESLISDRYGIVIDAYAHLQSMYSALAFTLVGSKRIFIDSFLLDDPRQEKRYRFTLSEEFAHSLIHHHVFENCNNIEERIQIEELFSEKERFFWEGNAKALAGALLMPKELFEQRVEFFLEKTKGKSRGGFKFQVQQVRCSQST